MTLADVERRVLIQGDERILDELETPERVHGRYERIELYSDEFVKMTQVRRERNLVSQELKDSIKRQLINAIDVVRLDKDMLGQYIDFVNDIWGSQTDIEEFEAQQRSDGNYYLIVAGHSRHQAIVDLEAEGALPPCPIEAKVHNVSSPEDIILLQLEENLHSQPAKERQAIAIVETYEWGQRIGKWATQKEFESQTGLSRGMLSDALHFAHLPAELRQYVFRGYMSYAAGIELGKTGKEIRRALLAKTGLDHHAMDDEQAAVLEMTVRDQIQATANYIARRKLNSTASAKYLRAERDRLGREMIADAAERERAEDAALIALDLLTPDEILVIEAKKAKSALTDYVREFSRMPATAAAELLELNRSALPQDTYEELSAEISRDFETSLRVGIKMLGSSASQTHPRVVQSDALI